MLQLDYRNMISEIANCLFVTVTTETQTCLQKSSVIGLLDFPETYLKTQLL